MKLLITILSVLNGGYMLLDGIHVWVKGKYIGPPKPGPWAKVFYALNVDVFKLGPLFIGYGLAWLIWLVLLYTNQSLAYTAGICLCIATLWYIPVGTLFSLIILCVLCFARNKVGI